MSYTDSGSVVPMKLFPSRTYIMRDPSSFENAVSVVLIAGMSLCYGYLFNINLNGGLSRGWSRQRRPYGLRHFYRQQNSVRSIRRSLPRTSVPSNERKRAHIIIRPTRTVGKEPLVRLSKKLRDFGSRRLHLRKVSSNEVVRRLSVAYESHEIHGSVSFVIKGSYSRQRQRRSIVDVISSSEAYHSQRSRNRQARSELRSRFHA